MSQVIYDTPRTHQLISFSHRNDISKFFTINAINQLESCVELLDRGPDCSLQLYNGVLQPGCDVGHVSSNWGCTVGYAYVAIQSHIAHQYCLPIRVCHDNSRQEALSIPHGQSKYLKGRLNQYYVDIVWGALLRQSVMATHCLFVKHSIQASSHTLVITVLMCSGRYLSQAMRNVVLQLNHVFYHL